MPEQRLRERRDHLRIRIRRPRPQEQTLTQRHPGSIRDKRIAAADTRERVVRGDGGEDAPLAQEVAHCGAGVVAGNEGPGKERGFARHAGHDAVGKLDRGALGGVANGTHREVGSMRGPVRAAVAPQRVVDAHHVFPGLDLVGDGLVVLVDRAGDRAQVLSREPGEGFDEGLEFHGTSNDGGGRRHEDYFRRRRAREPRKFRPDCVRGRRGCRSRSPAPPRTPGSAGSSPARPHRRR